MVAMQLDNLDLAVEYFETALIQRRRLANIGLTRANSGWAQFQLGQHAQAAKELRQALQFQPNMCVARYRLGRVYFARQEWNKALESFAQVAKDQTCGLQEAHLYQLKTLAALGMSSELAAVRVSCTALAPKSCVARECASIFSSDRVASPR